MAMGVSQQTWVAGIPPWPLGMGTIPLRSHSIITKDKLGRIIITNTSG